MSWVGFLIVGVVLLACSFLPFPHPVPRALQVVGGVLVVIALILLLVAALGTGTHSEVDVDGLAPVLGFF